MSNEHLIRVLVGPSASVAVMGPAPRPRERRRLGTVLRAAFERGSVEARGLRALMLFTCTASVCLGCELGGASRPGAILVDSRALEYAYIDCGYHETYGCMESLGIGLQFLDLAGRVVFRTDVEPVRPGSPAEVRAERSTRFEVEIPRGGPWSYRGQIDGDEAVLELDDLPDPSGLEDHDSVLLSGVYRIRSAVRLKEVSSSGDLGPGEASLDAQEIEFSCSASFGRGFCLAN